ncbi:TolC family protein [Methylomonas methanica]|uniref:Protein CyaE n=1 Tax=Methylomonas methanica (strain DSM 25384 / MC09) TaxID=857087 RepID=G0A7M1_METMM|nr:TolC family protein [Methylomonas methanica]AEG01864.1 outer membrane efflux protein [Methylomonas methanica MC09]
MRLLFKRFAVVLLTAAVVSGKAVAAASAGAFTLQQAIDFALENNPEISIMQARIDQADAQLGQALASFYPQVKASLSYQHSDNPAQAFAMIIAQRRLNFNSGDFNHPGGVDDYRPQVTATYSLFRGGQDYYLSQAAELGVETSELEKTATRHHLINNVTAAFYGYLAAEDAHELSLRSIEAVQSELDQSRVRYDAGTVLKSDVLSLEVQLAEAKDAQIQAANAIEIAKAMLKTLLGLSAEQVLTISENQSPPLPTAPAEFDVLLNQALSQHPELKAAEKRVLIAEQQLNAAQAAHLPRADAFVSYGSNSKDLAFSSNRDNVTAGVMVEVDVFSGFATQEKVKKAEHELTAARELARQMRLRVENQVKTAQLRLLEALNREQVTSVSVTAAEEALRLVKEQRNAGVVTVTRYIEAEVARDRAKTRDISARYDALRAEAELNQATGFWN